MDGASLVVRMLQAYEVTHVFGVPGDTNVPLYTQLARHRETITHVMARDERGAGYMADAYARVSNKPGVLEVPSGAGAMYALPAVAEAHGSSVPMVIITSDTPQLGEGRGVITELDCARLFESITKESTLVKTAVKIPETIRRAFRLATTGRPGAVHIVIPEDIFHEEVDDSAVSLHAEEACKTFPAYRPRATSEDAEKFLRLLTSAKRPLLVIGGGVNRSGSGAGPALTKFVERYGVPVVTTITGQNAILDTHELSIGIVGDNGFHPHANRAMEEADLLAYIGCRNGSVVSIGWTFPGEKPERRIAQVDIDPAVLGNNSENHLSILSDASLFLEDLNAIEPPRTIGIDSDWVATLNEWRQTFWHEENKARVSSSDLLRPEIVIKKLNERLKAAHLLFADPGTATPYLGRYLRLEDPGSRLLIPRAYGGLGYAIPAVVGSWIANPSIRPIGLFGDGSLGMAAGDLETISRLNIPAILINFNNSCFGWIKALQGMHGPGQFLSVDFSFQNCAAIAQAFGVPGLHVETEAQLETAFDRAFSSVEPIFIDIVVESIADRIPPVYNWLHKSGIDPLVVTGKKLASRTAA